MKHEHKRKGRSALHMKWGMSVVTFLLLCSISSLAADPPPETPAQARAAMQSAVTGQLARSGKVRVIVGLDTPFQAEGRMTNPAALVQRSNIHTGQEELLTELKGLDVSVHARFASIPFIAMSVDSHALGALYRSPRVSSVELDSLDRVSMSSSNAVIGSPEAWAEGYDGTGYAVAVLDTGVDLTHPWFTTGGSRIVSQACYSSNVVGLSESYCPGGVEESTAAGSGDDCGEFTDCDHGTHVAGTVAGNDGSGPDYGVARGADLIPIQVFAKFIDSEACGGDPPCSLSFGSDQVKAMERVLELSATIDIAAINLSLGGGAHLTEAACDAANPSMKAAIDNLRAAGIATVIASGNDYYRDAISEPGCISSAVSVGATTDDDQVASFSNIYAEIDLLAPGVSITSSLPGGDTGDKNGTSMATPHVAGAWAVLRQLWPGASVSDLEDVFRSDAAATIVSDNRGGGIVTNMKRINVDLAIDVIQGCRYTVTSPNGYEYWVQGEQYAINWKMQGYDCADTVKLELFKDNEFHSVVKDAATGTSYLWTVPANQEVVNAYRIKVTDGDNNNYSDQSDNNFTIGVEGGLGQPTGVQATDGEFTDRVRVTFNPVDGASVYEVFRCLTDGQTCGSPIGFPETGTFDDTGGNPGTVYYYRVRACNTTTCGALSEADTGFSDEETTPPIQREALVDLYNSTNGPGWTDSTNWLVGDPCVDSWYGVTCDQSENITKIELHQNNLVGTIPASLGNLSHLRGLFLRSNQLSGSIPPELEGVTGLITLLLGSNQLTGNIPPELGDIATLYWLGLENNSLSGSIPVELGDLTNLERLNLSGNRLTGSLPSELGNLSLLRNIFLQANQITGPVPPELVVLPNLEGLSLTGNQLTGRIPPELGTAPKLRAIELGDNQLSGTIPTELSDLTTLVSLYLNDNQLIGTIPPELGVLTNLRFLGLANNHLSGNIPAELAGLDGLQALNLEGNQLSGVIPTEIGSLLNLKDLHLASNQLDGQIPSELLNLTSLHDGYGMSLRWNKLFTDDSDLRNFLSSKTSSYWEPKQTIAPPDVHVSFTGHDSVSINWDIDEIAPHLSIVDQRYRVWYSQMPGGPYLDGGAAPHYSSNRHTVTNLLTDSTYYFVVRTETDSGMWNNQSDLVSEPSPEVPGSTFSGGTFSVGGSVLGMSGDNMVLQINGGDDLFIHANGQFSFATPLADGVGYSVTIGGQPLNPEETCSIENGSGTITGASVTSISVLCPIDRYSIGGNVTGMEGTGLVLQNNGGDDLSISNNGVFTFTEPVDEDSFYDVTIESQPTNPAQTCVLINSTGKVTNNDVSNVQVTCETHTFTVGGTVTGLVGEGLVLQNNGGDDLPIGADGFFIFPTALPDGSAYDVTVYAQPNTTPGENCSVKRGKDTLQGDNVDDVDVYCYQLIFRDSFE